MEQVLREESPSTDPLAGAWVVGVPVGRVTLDHPPAWFTAVLGEHQGRALVIHRLPGEQFLPGYKLVTGQAGGSWFSFSRSGVLVSTMIPNLGRTNRDAPMSFVRVHDYLIL